jgi:hypothetical protein
VIQILTDYHGDSPIAASVAELDVELRRVVTEHGPVPAADVPTLPAVTGGGTTFRPGNDDVARHIATDT